MARDTINTSDGISSQFTFCAGHSSGDSAALSNVARTMPTYLEKRYAMRQSDICECNHSRLVHIASCHMRGCKCDEFVEKQKSKHELDYFDKLEKENEILKRRLSK